MPQGREPRVYMQRFGRANLRGSRDYFASGRRAGIYFMFQISFSFMNRIF